VQHWWPGAAPAGGTRGAVHVDCGGQTGDRATETEKKKRPYPRLSACTSAISVSVGRYANLPFIKKEELPYACFHLLWTVGRV
jgi:hypothetical protein